MRRVNARGDDDHLAGGRVIRRCVETMSQQRARRLLLVGQPNVGKSLLFTRLTHRYATVSNYPGTTVEITSALAELDGELREVVDTPGTNTLAPQSHEERVTRGLFVGQPNVGKSLLFTS